MDVSESLPKYVLVKPYDEILYISIFFYRCNAHVLKETLIFLLCGVYFKFSFLIDLLIMAFQADMRLLVEELILRKIISSFFII